MPLELQPMQEEDMRALTLIQVAAFQGGMASFLFPNPITEEHIQKMTEKAAKSFCEESDVHMVKIVDTDSGGKMVAWAKWRINEKERTEEEIKGMFAVPSEDDKKIPARMDFLEHLNRSRRRFVGTQPMFLLHVLVTHPEYHRRGAGAQLVNWGTELADKAQLPSYLESSDVGKPLYARLGFEKVDEKVFDLAKYGSEGKDGSTIMIRPPQRM